ncbi:15932_t:CDS:1, partial [Gigaspora rosea]
RKCQQQKRQHDNMTIPEISNTSQRTYELRIKCQSDSIATTPETGKSTNTINDNVMTPTNDGTKNRRHQQTTTQRRKI